MRAFSVEGCRQELARHGAIRAKEVQRNVAVLLHGKRDRLEALRRATLDQAGPVHRGQTSSQPHGKLTAIGKSYRPQGRLAFGFERGKSPAVRRLEGEDPINAGLGAEDILDGQTAPGAGEEVRLEGHGHPGAGLGLPAVAGEQGPRNGEFLGVAPLVIPDLERLPSALLLGFDTALVEFLTPVDLDRVQSIPVPPCGDMAGAGPRMVRPGILLGTAARGGFLKLFSRGRQHAHLKAIAIEPVITLDAAGMVQRGQIHPSRQDVEVIRIPHRMNPNAVLVTLVLDIAAGQSASGQIPVIDLTIDDDLAQCRQHLKV